MPAVEAFVAAVKSGDIEAAKAQYPTSRVYFERIEPVAESFPNDLDPRIDLREADLEPGQKWTGFHALEKQLWVTGLQPDANALADQLVADVKELNAGVKAPDFTVDSTQIAGGAQGLLDEISTSKISGEEDIFSHTDLWDFNANLQGSQTAVASVRPILDERNPDLGKRVDQRFEEVEALLEKYREGDGFVLYDKVTEPERQELSRAIDALEQGSQPGARCHRPPVIHCPPVIQRLPAVPTAHRPEPAQAVRRGGGHGGGGRRGRRGRVGRSGLRRQHDRPSPHRGAVPRRASGGHRHRSPGSDALRDVRRHHRPPRRRHQDAGRTGPRWPNG